MKKALDWLRDEGRQLTTFRSATRPWQMPVAAALSSGLPVLVGASFGRLDYGLVSSLGGLSFLYLPNTPMHHRMATLMVAAFGMTACYALGVMTQAVSPLVVPLLTIVAVLVVMTVRLYQLPPPGALFFVMLAAIGAYSPVPMRDLPLNVGLVFMGGLLAAVIAFIYSAIMLRQHAPAPVPPRPRPTFEGQVVEGVLTGSIVGVSMAAAAILQMPRPYWVPVSCLVGLLGGFLIHQPRLRGWASRQLWRCVPARLRSRY